MILLTWNTQSCRGLDGDVSPRRIVQDARAFADFDVLCLQEIAIGYPGLSDDGDADQVSALSALLPGYRLFFGASVDEPAPDGGRRRFGNLIATRLPAASVQHHPLPWPADAGVASIPRMCTVVTVDDPHLGPLRVMTTHLEFYSHRQRLAQARALRQLHRAYRAQARTPPVEIDDGSPFGPKQHAAEAIVCGDFNCAPDGDEYAAITQVAPHSGLLDAWRIAHGHTPQPPTFCVHEQLYLPSPIACDFIFVSDGLRERVAQVGVEGKTRSSDHQPVMLRLA